MNKIDEIALRVAENGIGRMVSNVDICDFAHALLAELSKDAAPVSASEQKPVAWIDEKQLDAMQVPQMSRVTFQTYLQATNVWPGTVPLFTRPPNTADIEQRVAEAIAKMIQGWSCTNGPSIAEAIRSGKWREYL